jgi:hypothetical protein
MQFLDTQTGWVVELLGTILKTVDGGANWTNPLAPYRIDPAPWFWLTGLLSLGLLGFSVWPQRPHVTETSVADLLASDRPLRHRGEADALDLGVIAGSLSVFLRNRSTEAPLTIAVTGDWGSGKTSLMNLLRQDLTDNNFRPVWFNAWHHQKGEQILASLFAHIREQSIPPLTSWRGLRFRWRLLIRRGTPVWLLAALLLGVLATLAGYLWQQGPAYWNDLWQVIRTPESFWHKDWSAFTKLFTVLAGMLGSVLGLLRTMQGFGLDPQKLVTVNPQNRKTQGLDPGARARFAREFRDVTECLKPRKMVIFIDDLDRCSQHSLIEVLEAVNFLASSGDCFIVMGMSPSWVEACVGLEYEHLARAMAEEFPDEDDDGLHSAEHRRRFARNYLEKLINIEVPIPQLDQARAGVLVAPENGEANVQPRSWGDRLLKSTRSLSFVWKPILLLLVIGGGIWFGPHLLIKGQAPSPPKQIHWSTEDVLLSLPDDSATADTPGSREQVKDTQSAPNPAGARLAHTLSELLGIEISIKADPESLAKGLVLYEQGDDEHGWQLVLSEPKEAPPASTIDAGKETTSQTKTTPAPTQETDEKQPFELLPGSTPTTAIPAWALLLVAVLLLISAWQSSRRKALEITEDSRDFQQALRIWLPWLMAKQATPRAVKRFINRLRYIAIRLRKVAAEQHFPETNTVAIAAFHYLLPHWTAQPGAMEQFLIDPKGTIEKALGDTGDSTEIAEALSSCMGKYAKWAAEQPAVRGTWPPSSAHLDAFLAVLKEGSNHRIVK